MCAYIDVAGVSPCKYNNCSLHTCTLTHAHILQSVVQVLFDVRKKVLQSKWNVVVVVVVVLVYA